MQKATSDEIDLIELVQTLLDGNSFKRSGRENV